MGRKQDKMVDEMIVNMEEYDSEKLTEMYEQLDEEHKEIMDEAIRNYADSAIGDENWDSDD